jgi:hypothetical protein
MPNARAYDPDPMEFIKKLKTEETNTSPPSHNGGGGA